MIGIIGAMKEEVQAILDLMDVTETHEKLNYQYHIGKIAGKECVVVQGGIGKVNAAVSATLLFENYHPKQLINIGSAGGLSLDQTVGDVVISSRVGYHDVDVTAFNYEYGQMAGSPRFFEADPKLIEMTKQILHENHIAAHTGLIVSGDMFVAQKTQVENIKQHFPQAQCAEMEAAAIAQVCTIYDVPFIITRSLSDIFGKGNSEMQFDEYLQIASAASAKMCYSLVEKL